MYFKFRLLMDYSLAILTACIFGHPTWRLSPFIRPDSPQLHAIYLELFSVSATVLGFVLAASTFMISQVEKPKFALLRGSRSYGQFPSLIRSKLWRLTALMAASGLALFVDKSFDRVLAVVMLFLVTLALLSLIAMLWVAAKIIAIPPDNA